MSELSDLTCSCCICLKKSELLSNLDDVDSNNLRYIKKLIFCVPNETWKPNYHICNLCISQLDIAYSFVQCCIESEKFRKKDLEVLENELNRSEDNGSVQILKYTCDDCGKSFRQKRYLSQHITKLHIKKKQHSIKTEENSSEVSTNDVKSEVVELIDSTKEEQAEDSPEKVLKAECDVSSGILEVKEDLSDTEELEDAVNYDVEHQDYSCSGKSEDEDDFDEKPKIRSSKKSFKKEPQKCNFCDEIFNRQQDWASHIRTEHTCEKPFSCDQCDARYMNRYSLLIHSRKHKNEKPFICATCGKSFLSSADLNHHTKIHNEDRAYPCPMCDRSFKTHSNLRTHRLQMHLDPADWKFTCNLCDKKFPIRGNLMKHLKRHAGIKEFMCHICDKKFVNKAELTLHLNTHSNQRLFKCCLCDKDYKNREGLRRHMKVVHNQGNWKAPTVERKYLCPMCPKIFAFGNKLQRHIFTHTGEKPFECSYCPKRFIDKYGRKVHYKKDHNIEFNQIPSC